MIRPSRVLTTDERLRRENMSKNASLLEELGLTPSTLSFPDDSSAQESSSRSKKRKAPRKEHRDRWGHVIGLPPPGRKQRMACVEIRPDRKVNRAIDAGEYYDSTGLTEGEERRWRFGDGEGGELAEGEEPLVGGVGPDFRWKTLDAVDEALIAEMEERIEAEKVEEKPPPAPKVPYSVSWRLRGIANGRNCQESLVTSVSERRTKRRWSAGMWTPSAPISSASHAASGE